MALSRFEIDPAGVTAEERVWMDISEAAALDGFATVKDDGPESHYYRADPLSVEETRRMLHRQIAVATGYAAVHGMRDEPLTVEFVDLAHHSIFEPVFGETTLKIRADEVDRVEYPIVVRDGGELRVRLRPGSAPKQVDRSLQKVAVRFEEQWATLSETSRPHLRQAIEAAVTLYASLIRIHPYMDGNGRTARVVLTYAFQRCGLPDLAVPVTNETRVALGHALRRRGPLDYEPLVDIVEQAFRTSSRGKP